MPQEVVCQNFEQNGHFIEKDYTMKCCILTSSKFKIEFFRKFLPYCKADF